MKYAVGIAAALALTTAAAAQPAPDTAKYQPAILDLRACIRSNEPPAHIAGIHTLQAATEYLRVRCYAPYSLKLTGLGAGDAAMGSFRLVVTEEWTQFMVHLGY